MNSSTDYTREYSKDDAEKNKWWGTVSYIAFLFIIPLLLKKESKFVKFHANQGLVLFIFEAAVLILYLLLKWLFEFFALTSFLIFINAVSSVLMIFMFVLLVMGVMNASSALYKTLPFIGGIEFLK